MARKEKTQAKAPAVARVRSGPLPEPASRFSPRRIGVFGSVARQAAGPAGDGDIVVELAGPALDHHRDLKFYLEEMLRRSVDLVMADAVKPRLRPVTEQGAVYA